MAAKQKVLVIQPLEAEDEKSLVEYMLGRPPYQRWSPGTDSLRWPLRWLMETGGSVERRDRLLATLIGWLREGWYQQEEREDPGQGFLTDKGKQALAERHGLEVPFFPKPWLIIDTD